MFSSALRSRVRRTGCLASIKCLRSTASPTVTGARSFVVRRSFGCTSTRAAESLEGGLTPTNRIRNIAIIAHVDHGKTTLVDQLLRQSGTIKQLTATEQMLYAPSTSSSSTTTSDSPIEDGFITRVMDSNDLERERGITILSKCTSVIYNGNLINIVDTPGHADFGGEVERIMSMVDGVALVVDATEGPMTQTRFVLGKALSRGLKPLVVLNKADRPTARPSQVESDLFDLFATLGATDEQADYPLLYASAKQGWAQETPPKISASTDPSSSDLSITTTTTSMTSLFDLILSHVPAPSHLKRTGPFSMLTVQVENDSYVGALYLGRIHGGSVKVGDMLWAIDETGKKVGDGKVRKLFGRKGLERVEKDVAGAGEIVSIAGIKGGGVNITLVSPEGWGEGGPEALPITPIDPPTISIFVHANDSPLAGLEGNKLTSQVIRERIYKEAETNVALTVLPGPTSESLELRGRGVLHLGVLLETLRREGFELGVGPPKAVMLPDPNEKGKMLEPVEEVTVLVKEEYAGTVVQKLTMRKGEMTSYDAEEDGWVKVVMDIPARGLIGYMAGEFKNDVHGQGTINHIFKGYEPFRGPIDTGRNGALISMATGESSGYAMAPLQARGTLFIHPQIQVYPGMVIGESSKSQDLYLNPCVKKQLTNIRAAGADEKIVLASPRAMTLEEALAYMADDEIVEVTPSSVRLRKSMLDVNKRMKMKGKKP